MLAGLQTLVVGIIVVLAVLSLLWASCGIMGVVFRGVEARRKAAETARETARAAVADGVADQTAPADGIPPRHLAVIAAATTAALDRPHRIVHVWAPAPTATEWANQARLQAFTSHRLQGGWSRAMPPLGGARPPAGGA